MKNDLISTPLARPHTALLVSRRHDEPTLRRDAWAYYHAFATVTCEVMMNAANVPKQPYNALLRTSRYGRQFMQWVDLASFPDEKKVARISLKFIRALQKIDLP